MEIGWANTNVLGIACDPLSDRIIDLEKQLAFTQAQLEQAVSCTRRLSRENARYMQKAAQQEQQISDLLAEVAAWQLKKLQAERRIKILLAFSDDLQRQLAREGAALDLERAAAELAMDGAAI